MAVSVILGTASFLLCSACDGFLIHMRCDLVFYYKSTHMVMQTNFVNLTYRFVISFQSRNFGPIHVNSRAFTVIRVPKTVRPADSISLVFKQQLPAITQQFFQGNIFMTIAVTLPTIAVDPSACGHNTPSCERYRFRFRYTSLRVHP